MKLSLLIGLATACTVLATQALAARRYESRRLHNARVVAAITPPAEETGIVGFPKTVSD